jgi:hypothetical protein
MTKVTVKLTLDELLKLGRDIEIPDLIKKLGQENVKISGAKEELEESVALALQNWRDGLIEADDLVAFLVPGKLERIEDDDA